jgi:hypothetical protein
LLTGLRIQIRVNPHYFRKLDPDPAPDPHYSEKLDPDPHKSQNSESSEAQNRWTLTMEA